ncbi:MAG TPA: chemotaxis protein CheW, partial [Noviherbaspirillum sp.]
MQVLVFHIGDDGYGLATGEIARVLPLLQCKRIPGTPDWVAG